MGRLVVGVALEDAQELPDRIVRIAARRCVVGERPSHLDVHRLRLLAQRARPVLVRALLEEAHAVERRRGEKLLRRLRAPPLTPERQARGGAVEELLDVELEVGELQPDGALLSGHEVLLSKRFCGSRTERTVASATERRLPSLSGSWSGQSASIR